VSSRAVFVDRDGVINALVADRSSGLLESPLAVADVTLIEGAAAALARLEGAGWTLVGVSNQPAAAKGALSLDELHAIQTRVLELLSAEGVRFDDFRLCLHHPDGVVAGLSGACDCRKPAPGMLLDAASAADIELEASWMIGDTDADLLAGRAAGCRTVLVRNPGSAHKRAGDVLADVVAGDLAGAVAEILRDEE
jgi:D-glycero-D-manno-heptose 1,7-bisphosphate phosphatase